MEVKNIRSGKMMDKEFMNFLRIEIEMYEDILGEDRENFTEDFQNDLTLFIRKIIVNTECGNLHTEVD